MTKKQLKLNVTLSDDVLQIVVEGEVVRNLSSPLSGKIYLFTYKGEEFHFIYEEVKHIASGDTDKMVFVYPLNAFTERVFKLEEDEVS